MGGFSSNYEGGYLDFEDHPQWMSQNKKQKSNYNHLMQKKLYYLTSGSEYQYINILLTATSTLSPNEVKQRTELCNIDDADVLLELKHNKKDAKSLDIYYHHTFIGSVQKVFRDDHIDNSTIVNNFCFANNQLKDIEVIWDGETFFLKQKLL